MPFGENQLSPALIRLLLQSTSHPSGLQPTRVRPSTGFYTGFSLLMDRSTGFGSVSCHSTRYSHSLSLRLRTSSP